MNLITDDGWENVIRNAIGLPAKVDPCEIILQNVAEQQPCTTKTRSKIRQRQDVNAANRRSTSETREVSLLANCKHDSRQIV